MVAKGKIKGKTGSTNSGSKSSLRLIAVVSVFLLFVVSAIGGSRSPLKPRYQEEISVRDVNPSRLTPTDSMATKSSKIESDAYGGSWFDDLQDNSGMEQVENCSFTNGSVQLAGTFPIENWLYEDWSSRREIIIENPGPQELEGYQVYLKIDHLSRMQFDFGDIRFTYLDPVNDHEEVVPYWIEDKRNGRDANVWLNVTNIPAHGQARVLMYYGNYDASDESDGDSTFLFFDDFNDGDIDTEKWETIIDNDFCRHSLDEGNLLLDVHNAWNVGVSCLKKEQMNVEGSIIEAKQRLSGGGTKRGNNWVGCSGIWIFDPEGVWYRTYGRSAKEDAWLKYSSSQYLNGTIWSRNSWNGTDTGYHVLGMKKNGNLMSLYEDNSFIDTIVDTGIVESSYSLDICNQVAGFDGSGWRKQWTDWFRVRKHVMPEPTARLEPVTGYVDSISIELPESMKWDVFSVNIEEPERTSIRIDIIDTARKKTIPGYEEMATTNVDLSGLNGLEISTIMLRARLSGEGGITPTLHSWGVEWMSEYVWRDSFIGDGKVRERTGIDISDKAEADEPGIDAHLYSEMIHLPNNMTWAELIVHRLVPEDTALNITIHNGKTDEVLLSLNNSSSNLKLDLSSLFPENNGRIYLRANFTSTEKVSPILYYWAVRVAGDSTPPIAFAGEDISIEQYETAYFNAEESVDNIGIVNYTWSFLYNGSEIVLYGLKPNFIFNIADTYTVTLTVMDLKGNSDTDVLTVNVREDGDEPPTPPSDEVEEEDTDGDGYNDTYENETGSDPYDPKSIPSDWDGDGVPNHKDAYPRDATKWKREDGKGYVLWVILFCGAGVVLFLICFFTYSRINKKNVFRHDTRANISLYIMENPGKHFREITRQMGINRGTLSYHIKRLENIEQITSKYDGHFKRYYPADFGRKECPLTPMEEKIVNILRKNPGITYEKLIPKVGRSFSTLSYHMMKLVDKKVVEGRREDKRLCWYLLEKEDQ